MSESGHMLTNIYVDGFNLYYGRLKSTSYKWLDLQALFGNMLGSSHVIQSIKYFTAPVTPSRASSAPGAPDRQKAYLRALETLPSVEIHLGKFREHDNWMYRSDPPHHRIRVIKTEEKQSDVNLSVHLLNDAWKDNFECAVVVSDDTDMVGAMRMVKREFPRKRIGLVSPRARAEGQSQPPSPGRPWFSAERVRYAKFKLMIEDAHLATSQLPDPVARPNLEPISKPSSW